MDYCFRAADENTLGLERFYPWKIKSRTDQWDLFQHLGYFYGVDSVRVSIVPSHQSLQDINIDSEILQTFGKIQNVCDIFPKHQRLLNCFILMIEVLKIIQTFLRFYFWTWLWVFFDLLFVVQKLNKRVLNVIVLTLYLFLNALHYIEIQWCQSLIRGCYLSMRQRQNFFYQHIIPRVRIIKQRV